MAFCFGSGNLSLLSVTPAFAEHVCQRFGALDSCLLCGKELVLDVSSTGLCADMLSQFVGRAVASVSICALREANVAGAARPLATGSSHPPRVFGSHTRTLLFMASASPMQDSASEDFGDDRSVPDSEEEYAFESLEFVPGEAGAGSSSTRRLATEDELAVGSHRSVIILPFGGCVCA